MNKSIHSIKRGQQRGFQRDYVDLILRFGTPERKPGNTFEFRIREKDRKRIIQSFDKIPGKAVLVDGEKTQVITVYNVR